MSERITKLLRTNIALALLCVISIGVLVLLARTPERGGGENSDAAKAMAVAANPISDALAHSPLKDMPAPSHFKSFTYVKGGTLNIKGDCQDSYRVTLIFPAEIDYRIDTLSAKYNAATACAQKGSYSELFNLDSAHLTAGEKYYMILASEGEQGIWHDPQ